MKNFFKQAAATICDWCRKNPKQFSSPEFTEQQFNGAFTTRWVEATRRDKESGGFEYLLVHHEIIHKLSGAQEENISPYYGNVSNAETGDSVHSIKGALKIMMMVSRRGIGTDLNIWAHA